MNVRSILMQIDFMKFKLYLRLIWKFRIIRNFENFRKFSDFRLSFSTVSSSDCKQYSKDEFLVNL